MAVREFDGSDDGISLSGGALGALCNGAYSIVVIAKPNAVSPGVNANKGFVSIQISTTDHLGGLNTEDGSHPQHLALFTDVGALAEDVDMDASWQILGLSKSSGTTSPRFHRKALGSGSWSHASPGGTMANQAGTATRVEIARFMGSGNNIAGRMAAVAVFPTELSDASFESIQTTPSTQTLLDLGAVGLWELNQPLTTMSIVDRTGGGANQTAITGTTAVTGDDPPGWTFTETPEFVGVGDFRTFGTSATDVDADTPTGITAGDTIFFVLLINDAMKATVAYPGSVTQVGSWVTGVTDFVGTVPATGLFRATWDGVATDYAFTFDDVGDRGGGIATYGYTGDCTHRQTVTGTDPEGSASRNSPTLNGTSGNLVFAAMGGSANTTTNTWSGGFTERDDQENYGVNTGADAPSGASVTATLDPGAASTQSMWILEEIGPEGGFAPGSAAWVGTL